MKTFFKWLLYALSLVFPLIMMLFVWVIADEMFKVGSPLVPGHNYLRWSHLYLFFGTLLCLGFYIPVMGAMITQRLKPLLANLVLIPLLFIASIALAVTGRNVYCGQQAREISRLYSENKDPSEALARLGAIYSNNGDYTKAIELFNQALERSKNPAYVLHDRGTAYAGLQSYDRAIADYSKAMELKPDEKGFLALCYNDRGAAYFYAGISKASYEDVAKAIALGYKVKPAFIAALKKEGFEVVAKK